MHLPVSLHSPNPSPTKPAGGLASLLGVACAGALTGVPALAQTDPSMPVVEVVGTTPLPGIGIDRKLLPYPVQTASEREREQSGAGNLSEYMAQNLTGVNVNEVQGSPFQNDLTFRGYRASPLLGAPQGISVFLDGVRINEGFGDVINWDMLPEAAIASVMLVPGANPTYGLNSLGGALAFRTKSGRTDPGFEGNVSLGSFGRKRIDLAYGTQFEDGWHAFVAGTRFAEDGWRDHSNGRLGNVLARFGRNTGRNSWDLSLLHGSSTLVGNGLLPDELYESDRRTVYTHPDRSKNRVEQLSLNSEHWIDKDTVVTALVFGRKSRRSTVNGDINPDYESYAEACEGGFDASGAPLEDDECVDDAGNPLTRDAALGIAPGVLNQTRTRQTSYGLGLNLSRDTGIHKFSLGVSADRNKVRYDQTTEDAAFDESRGAVAFPGAEAVLDAAVRGHAWNAAVYASDTLALSGATHLTASARYNVAKVTNTLTNEDGPQPTESFRYTKFNPALGITHQLGSGWTLFANLAQNTRVPTVIELGCADPEQPCALPTGLQADPFLEQVTSRTIEAGARYGDRKGTLSVSVYQSVNRDDILFLRAGATQLGYFDNFERTRHRGLDLSARRKLGRFAARLGYSYLEATYDANGSLFAGERTVQVSPGTRIAGLPRHTFKLGLDWRPSTQWLVGADLVAVSRLVTQGNEDGLLEDPEDDEPLETGDAGIAGHALLSLRASYKPSKQLEFYARVNNALNRRYETYGVLAENLFPGGQLAQPALATDEAQDARFVAPGAPRSFNIGMNYRF